MSSYKAKRASFNRGLRVSSIGVTRKEITQVKPTIELDTFQAQKRHLRPLERYAWRVRVARGFEGDRLSKRARDIIEGYENYLLRKRYASANMYNVVYYTLAKYVRQYHRKQGVTIQVYNEVCGWYNLHGTDRIQRMRKMHAIVGTENHVILRTE